MTAATSNRPLADRFRRHLANPVVAALVATSASAGTRLMLDHIVPHVVPYATVFAGVAIATLLAGARAGLLTIALCQTLIWLYVLPPRSDPQLYRADIIGLALAVLSQGVIVWSIERYRRSVEAQLHAERLEREVAELAMRELDHRTKNNFQMAQSVLRLRARHVGSEALRDELDRAAHRLISLEAAYSNQVVAAGPTVPISIKYYVEHMVARLKEGFDGLDISFVIDVADIAVSRRIAISVGMILNEAITNSVKHAFADRAGVILVKGWTRHGQLIVEISDNGPGIDSDHMITGDGIGTKLVEAIARSINASITPLTSNDGGVGYRISLLWNSSAQQSVEPSTSLLGGQSMPSAAGL